jgi:hypothetical protein
MKADLFVCRYDNAICRYMTVEDTNDEESFKDKPFIIRTRIGQSLYLSLAD